MLSKYPSDLKRPSQGLCQCSLAGPHTHSPWAFCSALPKETAACNRMFRCLVTAGQVKHCYIRSLCGFAWLYMHNTLWEIHWSGFNDVKDEVGQFLENYASELPEEVFFQIHFLESSLRHPASESLGLQGKPTYAERAIFLQALLKTHSSIR